MQDRYLFRGKRIDNGKWIEGFYDEITKGADLDPIENCSRITTFKKLDNGEIILTGIHSVDPATVGQCTGLKDKNGELIFEGDLIKYEGKTYEVVWDKCGWNCKGFYNSGYDYPGEAFSEGMGGFEVISNIHDKEGEDEV